MAFLINHIFYILLVYRSAVEFCTLILYLYLATSPNFLLSFNILSMSLVGHFEDHRIIAVNNDNLSFSFTTIFCDYFFFGVRASRCRAEAEMAGLSCF